MRGWAYLRGGPEPKGDGTDEGLAKLGLDLRVITAPPNLGGRKATIRELERRGGGVLIVRIERADGTVIESPSPSEIIRTGDALAVVSKSGRLNLEGLAD